MTYYRSNETSLKLFLMLKWSCVKKSLQQQKKLSADIS